VKLYHRTTEGQKIAEEGFAVCHIPQGGDSVWLCSSEDGTRAGKGGDWMVIVTLPDDVAERYVYEREGDRIEGLYEIPQAVINGYMPFELEFRREFPDR